MVFHEKKGVNKQYPQVRNLCIGREITPPAFFHTSSLNGQTNQQKFKKSSKEKRWIKRRPDSDER
jgi:hypothetical protein